MCFCQSVGPTFFHWRLLEKSKCLTVVSIRHFLSACRNFAQHPSKSVTGPIFYQICSYICSSMTIKMFYIIFQNWFPIVSSLKYLSWFINAIMQITKEEVGYRTERRQMFALCDSLSESHVGAFDRRTVVSKLQSQHVY